MVTQIRESEAQKDLLKQQLEFKTESLKNNQEVVKRNEPLLVQLKDEFNSKKNQLEAVLTEIINLEKEYIEFELAHQKAEKEYKESKTQFDVIAEKRQSLEQQSFEKAKNLRFNPISRLLLKMKSIN